MGRAVRDLVSALPKAGVNILAVTHKTNVADAFGKEFANIREGEALVYKISVSGPAVLIARVPPGELIAQPGSWIRSRLREGRRQCDLPATRTASAEADLCCAEIA